MDGRTLVAMDLPGHGKSPVPADGKFAMDRFTDSMVAVLDVLHAQKAVLVGHSNGTPMIRCFARRHPERTAALVTVDGALRNLFGDSTAMEQFIAPMRGPLGRKAAASFVDGMLPPSMPAERRDFIRSRMLATPQSTMVGAFEAVDEKGVWNDDPIRVPLLVINAQSPFWTPEYEAYVRKLAPQVDYQTMTGVSHFLMMDAPDEFDRRLEEFLEKNGL
jgi:pimeloyl-ACP methyl ester carboxylesterase